MFSETRRLGLLMSLVVMVVACNNSATTPSGKNTAPVVSSIGAAPLINELHVALMGATNLTFSADGAADPDGDPLTYSWDFGDGVTAQGATPTHRYNAAGAFTARVTVSDGRGATATTTRAVRVASLNGTWDGTITRLPGSPLAASSFTVVVTHSGNALTGIWSDNGGATNRFAPGFLTDPFTVSFSCESCPSNGSRDLVVRGPVITALNRPVGPGFDVYNTISGPCTSPSGCTHSSFSMSRR
jgi:PKD repeat protein